MHDKNKIINSLIEIKRGENSLPSFEVLNAQQIRGRVEEYTLLTLDLLRAFTLKENDKFIYLTMKNIEYIIDDIFILGLDETFESVYYVNDGNRSSLIELLLISNVLIRKNKKASIYASNVRFSILRTVLGKLIHWEDWENNIIKWFKERNNKDFKTNVKNYDFED